MSMLMSSTATIPELIAQERNEKSPEYELETPKEMKERWRSIRIIYFTVFLMSLGFSIVITGVWPYLNKLDASIGKEFMGWVVAANPLAQMLFSPPAGWWANKLGSITLPLVTSIIIFILSSAIYSSLEIFVAHRGAWMFISRFLVGVSCANMAVCRSYTSAATRIDERTGALSMIALAQVLGFIVGPALQAAVTPLGDVGWVLWEGRFSLDMYTACGWISVLLGVINLVLFLPSIFKERTIAGREAMHLIGATSEKAAWKEVKPDYLSAWTLIVAFFIFSFNFVLLETLGTSLTMDQFAWTKREALYYMGILMSVGGVIACLAFVVLERLCKRFGEVNILLWGGFLFMVIGCLSMIPWGTDPPVIAFLDDVNGTSNSTEEIVGCPSTQSWCFDTPAMTVRQFFIGYVFVSLGYPVGLTLLQTVFSKVLGPRPQGVWMGLLTGSGCLSRVMGPICVSIIYTRLGTVWTFGLTSALMAVTTVWLRLLQDRLVDSSLKATNLTKKKVPDEEGNKYTSVELKDMAPPS